MRELLFNPAVAATVLLAVLAGACVAASLRARRRMNALRRELQECTDRLDATERARGLTVERCKDLEQKLSVSDECLIMTESKVAKLEDRVKMLVARHLEHDLWAQPLRGALGASVSEKVRELTARIEQQDQAIAQRDRTHALMKARLAQVEAARAQAAAALAAKERQLADLAQRVGQLESNEVRRAAGIRLDMDLTPDLAHPTFVAGPPARLAAPLSAPAPEALSPVVGREAVDAPTTGRWVQAMEGATKEEQLEVLRTWQERLERRLGDLENLQVRLHRVYSRVPELPGAQETPAESRGSQSGKA